jgi:hypothetical protein
MVNLILVCFDTKFVYGWMIQGHLIVLEALL